MASSLVLPAEVTGAIASSVSKNLTKVSPVPKYKLSSLVLILPTVEPFFLKETISPSDDVLLNIAETTPLAAA
jgi:hypothetical protein